MPISTVALPGGVGPGTPVGEAVGALFTTGLEASALVRAAVAFAFVVLVGGGIRWRAEAFVDRSIDATLDRPLVSVGYGVAALLVVGFGAVYLASQLAQITVGRRNAGSVGLLVGALAVLLACALGFTVVGGALVLVWGGRNDWSGLALGALVAGTLAALDPFLAGVGWVAVVSLGIGGRVRTWLHASFGPAD